MTLIGRRPVRPVTAYLWFRATGSLLNAMAFTLLLVYQVQTAHFSPIELVLAGTVMEATCFLAEVPTGLVADLYSRRLSILIGVAVIGIGVLIQGLFPAFLPILAATWSGESATPSSPVPRRPGSPTRSARRGCWACSPGTSSWTWG